MGKKFRVASTLAIVAAALWFAGSARADITDSGSALLGQQAVIAGTMTVTGQDGSGYSVKFTSSVQTGGCYKFGDGTVQCTAGGGGGSGAGDAVLSGTQTFSGGNTFASSVTVRSGGRAIVLSTSPTSGSYTMMINGDGTLATRNIAVHNSSRTVNFPNWSFTHTFVGPCAPGSTVTITTNGESRLYMEFGAFGETTPTQASGYGSFLIDGVNVVYPITGDPVGLIFMTQNVVQQRPFFFSFISDVVSPGAHQVCPTLATSAGTMIMYSGTRDPMSFWVWEVK